MRAGAAVVPAAATLYAMGLELPPSTAASFDLSCMDKYRCHRRCMTPKHAVCAHTSDGAFFWGVLGSLCHSGSSQQSALIGPCQRKGRRDETGGCLCRYAKSYEAVHLEDVPHRVLTRPKKVFEYIFEGQRPARGRENMVKLDVSAHGALQCM